MRGFITAVDACRPYLMMQLCERRLQEPKMSWTSSSTAANSTSNSTLKIVLLGLFNQGDKASIALVMFTTPLSSCLEPGSMSMEAVCGCVALEELGVCLGGACMFVLL